MTQSYFSESSPSQFLSDAIRERFGVEVSAQFLRIFTRESHRLGHGAADDFAQLILAEAMQEPVVNNEDDLLRILRRVRQRLYRLAVSRHSQNTELSQISSSHTSDPVTAAMMSEALECLTPEEMLLFHEAFLESTPRPEIAQIFDISRATLYRRLEDLTAKLRRYLEMD
ncbi:MAG: sigma-70 family RNA polymerase sigma factor [Rhodopirellula sp.]|nr:sigma-70 family RNA polymerase sigma factor [Rhodopirellula sp.]